MNYLVQKFSDLEDLQIKLSPIVCLYSGGLDSTYLLLRLRSKTRQPIVALHINCGQSFNLNQETKEKLEKFDIEFLNIDVREEFISDFVVPAIQSKAKYLNSHPISSSLSRPLMIKTAIEIAEKFSSQVILHSANPTQNSLRRFNGALKSLGFNGAYGSPYELSPVSRREKLDFLNRFGFKTENSKGFSSDCNLWCREFESEGLDNPEAIQYPESLFEWSIQSKTNSEMIEIEFKQGIPIRLNGKDRTLIEMIQSLNTSIGSFGLGRFLALEELENGKKFLELREMPAAYFLYQSFQEIESAVLTSDCIREKLSLEQTWVNEAITGRWYGPLRKACQAFITSLSKNVSGKVRYQTSPSGLSLNQICVEKPLYGYTREPQEKSINNYYRPEEEKLL